jgi:hypothetical protein
MGTVNSCMIQPFCLGNFQSSIRAVRTAQDSGRPDPNDVGGGYRALRYIRRYSRDPTPDLHTHTGARVPSSVSQRSSRPLHCPSSFPCGSYCSRVPHAAGPSEMMHCSTGCYDPNDVSVRTRHRDTPTPFPKPNQSRKKHVLCDLSIHRPHHNLPRVQMNDHHGLPTQLPVCRSHVTRKRGPSPVWPKATRERE